MVAENNRLGRALREVRPRIEAHIAWLEQELSELDGELRQTILSSPVWREKDEHLRSVPGVGNQVSMTLLADLPELGSLGRKQIAALVGVAGGVLAIVLLVFLASHGQEGENKYGSQPK